MKNTFKLILVFAFVLFACEEDYEHKPISTSLGEPSPIENLNYTPVNGGFDVTYDLPAGDDLLYVKAIYTNNGVESEVKASVYDNKMKILGFGNMEEKEVTLYVVNRSEKVSRPVSFKAAPLQAPVSVIQENMTITPDFGGARFTWINEDNTPIAIMLMGKDEFGDVKVMRTVYTSQSETSTALRGYEAVPQYFAAVIRDRFDNISDTIYPSTPDKLLTPLFEMRLDKKKFIKMVRSNDANWDAWGNNYSNLFDDNLNNISHTQGNTPRPDIYTLDLGAIVTLSRFKLYGRGPNDVGWAYNHGNPKKYTVYGAKELPASDDLSAWTKLRDCESIKPSGLPIGTNTDEDIEQFLNGDEFTFEDSVEIRYFRIAITEVWDGAGYTNMNEITFWGSVSN